MTYTESHIIILTKPALRNLQTKVVEANIQNIVASVNNKSLKVRGWTVKPDDPRAWHQGTGVEEGMQYLYSMYLVAEFSRDDNQPPNKHEFPTIVRTIHTRAGQPAFGKWDVTSVDGDGYTPSGETADTSDLVGYAPVDIPADWEKEFSHLYGLESHIKRIKRALEAGIMSDWTNRYHCVLVGQPGCGKSDTCKTIKRILGEDAVLEFDATATTSAGVIKDLSEREILPRVMIVEEIEKADEKSLAFLLALCDLRGEIRKTTARGKIERDTKMFVIATVNNVPLFDKLMAGALSSRFANKIWFKRPDRAMLAMILEREVSKIDGDYAWIEPALDYCDVQGISDPRMVTAICLCGRDELITGEYQKMLAETGEATIDTEEDPFK